MFTEHYSDVNLLKNASNANADNKLKLPPLPQNCDNVRFMLTQLIKISFESDKNWLHRCDFLCDTGGHRMMKNSQNELVQKIALEPVSDTKLLHGSFFRSRNV